MVFWGIEVKPGKPYPYHSDNVPGRLHITQATLGLGAEKERSIVQCTIGRKSPVFVCSLLPNKIESCSLDLEFGEDELIAFSVIGPRSIHLSGYFEAFEEEETGDDYEYDPYGDGISDSEASESDSLAFNTSDEYADDFSDDEDVESEYDVSPVRKSGVVIEEIEDDEKPAKENGQSKQPKKKKNLSTGLESSEQQIVLRGESGDRVLESEDEDGFPISSKSASDSNVQKPEANVKPTDIKNEKNKKKITQDSDSASKLKRKVEIAEEEGCQEKKIKKKNKQLKEQDGVKKKSDEHEEKKADEKSVDIEVTPVAGQSQKQEKNKKKNKKGKDVVESTSSDQTVTAKVEQKKPSSASAEKKIDSKSSQMRTYPNGLVVEEISMGKPDGKRASLGVSVAVRYIGKLKKNGKIFDSNIGKRPFNFRLGTGQVIPGWDVGVSGMRVGDKRRLTIPPEMGYGSKGAGGAIPPNAWLVFDVELISVAK